MAIITFQKLISTLITLVIMSKMISCSGSNLDPNHRDPIQFREDPSGQCGDLTWELYNNKQLNIYGQGNMSCWDVFPPWYEYRSNIQSVIIQSQITSIGPSAFQGCESLTTVYIPSTIQYIMDSAFKVCTNLSLITFPNSVTYIGEGAFMSCSSLTSISIPSSVTSILNYTFILCSSLTSVTFLGSITYIGHYAFSFCYALPSFTIPASVNYIAEAAFWECVSLESFDVDFDNLYYKSVDGVLFDKNLTALYQYPPANSSTHYSIPSSVTYISEKAFLNCTKITSLDIPSSVETLASFADCSLLSLTLDNENGLRNYQENFPPQIRKITLGNSITRIPPMTFSHLKALTTITIPESVESIEDNAFEYCEGLTSVTLPKKLNHLGYSAFYFCKSLTSISIPDTLTSIPNNGFQGCSSLTSIIIPASVTLINSEAFWNCTSLESVTYYGKINPGPNVFEGCPLLTKDKIHLPPDYKGEVFCGIRIVEDNDSKAVPIIITVVISLVIIAGIVVASIFIYKRKCKKSEDTTLSSNLMTDTA